MLSERARDFYFLAEQIKTEHERALPEIKQGNSQPECFRVMAVSLKDECYFVGRLAHSQDFFWQDFLWCHANQRLKAGDIVKGYLLDGTMPILVIN